ncbi:MULTISPECIES: hypothetical protein [Actinomycetes]|uniref:hypothetical protein n=1 Tax=Actinomycetes TaxID=1760 RepID=UPI0001DEE22D|nr:MULTISPECIES: hypothetical protein [Actinomycetes]EFL06800.1 predicted protein [Streptomyces sp. AA4]
MRMERNVVDEVEEASSRRDRPKSWKRLIAAGAIAVAFAGVTAQSASAGTPDDVCFEGIANGPGNQLPADPEATNYVCQWRWDNANQTLSVRLPPQWYVTFEFAFHHPDGTRYQQTAHLYNYANVAQQRGFGLADLHIPAGSIIEVVELHAQEPAPERPGQEVEMGIHADLDGVREL